MRILFYCDSIPFGLRSLGEHPLGGTESSVLSLSREIAALGHEVTIVAKTNAYDVLENVEIIPVHTFDLNSAEGDVFVSVRDVEVLTRLDTSKFGKVVFWCHDVTQHPSVEHLLNDTAGVVSQKVDAIAVVSEYVRGQIHRWRIPHLRDKVHVMRNAVDDRFLVKRAEPGEELHVTYHSMPYRGLVYLLDMWPSIVEAVPNARLHLRTGNQIYGGADGENEWLWNRAKRVGAILHGPTSYKELMASLAMMDVHLYPTDFVESSCTATMMSLASGCAVVTTDLGALREQIDETNGILVEGHPGNRLCAETFRSEVVNLLNDVPRLRRMQERAKKMAGETWSKRAHEWLKMIEGISK